MVTGEGHRLEPLSTAILDALPDGVVVVDALGVVVFCNPAAGAMLGLAPERLVGAAFGLPVADHHSVQVDLLDQGSGTRVVEMRAGPVTWGAASARVLSLRDVTEASLAFQRAELAATHDALTGVGNRTLMAAHLEQAMHFAQRDGNRVALLFIDIDDFKMVNDRLGHTIGDALLVSVARRLSALLRAGDGVARLGGDEFTVTLAGLAAADYAGAVAAKVIAELQRPHVLGPHAVSVHASVGSAVFPDDAEDVAGLLRRADEAVYQAKGHGKARHVAWRPPRGP